MPEMIGATARSPAQSTHFWVAVTGGVTAIRSGSNFLSNCRCWGSGLRDAGPVAEDRPELLREIGSRRAERIGLGQAIEAARRSRRRASP
jgi:hypothetical protein